MSDERRSEEGEGAAGSAHQAGKTAAGVWGVTRATMRRAAVTVLPRVLPWCRRQWSGLLVATVLVSPFWVSQRAATRRAERIAARHRFELGQLRAELAAERAGALRLRTDLARLQSASSSGLPAPDTGAGADAAPLSVPPGEPPQLPSSGTGDPAVVSSARDEIDRQLNLLEARLPSAETQDEENRRWNDQQLEERRRAYEDAGRKIRELNDQGKTDEAVVFGATAAALGAAVESSDWKRSTDNAEKIRMEIARLKNERLTLR